MIASHTDMKLCYKSAKDVSIFAVVLGYKQGC